MKLFKPLLIWIVPIAAVCIAASGYKMANNSNLKLCQHQFALCTSARCVPLPEDPDKAICSCDVEEGPSMASVACYKLKPSTDEYGIRTLYSTFSFKQFHEGKKILKCPQGTPWTWCLNKRCTVDPSNSKKAICVCDVMRSEQWITLGGNCDTSTCQTGYWSGANLADFQEGNIFLNKALGLTKSPVKWCEVSQ